MPTFVDTNVLLYARDPRDAGKQQRALLWLDTLWNDAQGRLSPQVLHEFYWNVRRKLAVASADAREDVRAYRAWVHVAIDAPLTEAAFEIESRDGLSFWDALILAAAERSGCERLLSEDLTEGRRYGSVLVVNPFTTPP